MKSKERKPISAKQRESDDKLRRELENADPKKFESAGQSAFPFFQRLNPVAEAVFASGKAYRLTISILT